MAIYRYEAVDRSGQAVFGAMHAGSEAEVVTRLTQAGYRCLTVQRNGASPTATFRGKASWSFGRPPSAEQMAVMFRQLSALVRAGLPLHEACQSLSERLTHPALRSAAQEMAARASRGGRVSDAMAERRDLFPPHVVGGVRAGEEGGFVDAMLDEIALGYEEDVALFRGARLARAALWQGVVGLALVQPVFPALLPEANLRAYLLAALGRNLPIILAAAAAGRWWVRHAREGPRRETLDRWRLRIPHFGPLAQQRALSVFVRTLRRLFSAGLDPETVWESALAVVPNLAVRAQLAQASALVAHHAPLHEAFAATGLFPAETINLLASGHQAGAVPEMLDRVAALQHGEVESTFAAARFWMFRTAVAGGLLLAGLAFAFLMKGYFDAVFRFTEGWAD